MKYEYKYVVPLEKLDELRAMVSPFVFRDGYMDISGADIGYTVRSIYFDTPRYDHYHDKIDGLKIRKKIRIRGYNTYNDDNIVFLEIKRKNEKKIYKNRLPVRFKDLGAYLYHGNPEKYIITDILKNDVITDSQYFLFNIYRHTLQPTVLVVYDREAYFGKYDRTFRITFDKNLRGAVHPSLDSLYDDDRLTYASGSNFVFEVKFYNVYPSWLKRINVKLGLRLGSFSKYTTCIDNQITIRNNSRQLPGKYQRLYQLA